MSDNIIERLGQSRDELRALLFKGLIPIGYWQVQILDVAANEIERLRAHIERGKDLLQSAYTRSSIEDGSPLSVEICHYLHVEKP